MFLGALAEGWPLLVALGCASGFFSGLLGIGGGAILVPALVAGLPLLGVEGPEVVKIAMATSLALIIPTSIAATQMHISKEAVDWRLLALLGPSIIAGSFVAAVFAKGINVTVLSGLFVAFALYTAWGLMQRQNVRSSHALPDSRQPGLIRITVTGVLGGALSSLLGLGVAFFAVPLMARSVSVQTAIGTAAALGIPMALAGTAGHVLAGAPAGCREGCAGYIFLPAVAAIGISAVLAAPMGARLTHMLPVILLRRLFGCLLILAAGHLALKTLPLASVPSAAGKLLARLTAPATAERPVAAEPPACLGEAVAKPLTLTTACGPRRQFALTTQSPKDAAIAGVLSVLHQPSAESEFWRFSVAPARAEDADAVLPPVPQRADRRSNSGPTSARRISKGQRREAAEKPRCETLSSPDQQARKAHDAKEEGCATPALPPFPTKTRQPHSALRRGSELPAPKARTAAPAPDAETRPSVTFNPFSGVFRDGQTVIGSQ